MPWKTIPPNIPSFHHDKVTSEREAQHLGDVVVLRGKLLVISRLSIHHASIACILLGLDVLIALAKTLHLPIVHAEQFWQTV